MIIVDCGPHPVTTERNIALQPYGVNKMCKVVYHKIQVILFWGIMKAAVHLYLQYN
jgi:hypothetical protein